MTHSQLSRPIRIATRESPLALWQAQRVAAMLDEHQIESELVPLVSRGDTDLGPIDGTRQVGIFTKRIQQALLDDEADVAVHSLKDLPTATDLPLALTAVPERESVLDCLVSPAGVGLEALPDGARIGTGSRRRASQLRRIRPDLRINDIRGNVQSRLAKLAADDYDAIILAEAGLLRLELNELPRTTLSLDEMLPAPGQGALAIETRIDDFISTQAVAQLDDRAVRAAVMAERGVLSALHGGCLAPIAAHAVIVGSELELTALVLSADGSESIECKNRLPLGDDWIASAGELAALVSETLRSEGAVELIEQSRGRS